MSDLTTNPDLLPVGADPNNQSVKPLANITAALPSTPTAEVKYYVNTVANSSMHRNDGKKLGFVFGMLETNDKFDKEYLDTEIEQHRNPYIRYATEQEIKDYRIRTNPREVMEKEIRASIEEEMRLKLTKEIEEEKLKGTDGILEGVDPPPLKQSIDMGGGAKLTPTSTADLSGMLGGAPSSKS